MVHLLGMLTFLEGFKGKYFRIKKCTVELQPEWDPAGHCSKANKEAKLVERKFALFWMWNEVGRSDIYPKASSPHPDNQGAITFLG